MSNEQVFVRLEGRLVCGHPMVRRTVKKKQNGPTAPETPVLDDDGVAYTTSYLALAIPKAGETDWKQTLWGQQFVQKAQQDWPNGESGAPTFKWKVDDGDSMIPNQAQKKPAEREGWPGHWIVHCTTAYNRSIKCYHVGKYEPMQQIQVDAEIKTGDYARVSVGIKGNDAQSQGIYVSPGMFELSRAGVQIISESGPSAADVFGGVQPNVPVNAQVAPAIAAPQPPVVPATDFVNSPGTTAAAPPPPLAEPKYVDANGGHFTYAELTAVGYSPEQIAALPKAP